MDVFVRESQLGPLPCGDELTDGSKMVVLSFHVGKKNIKFRRRFFLLSPTHNTICQSEKKT